VDDYYAARSGLIPPLPWPTFSPPFSRESCGTARQKQSTAIKDSKNNWLA
jgi:hypothetical protein